MNLILGVTGSISAYKAVDLMHLFQKGGHAVSVVLTANAERIIPALTFATFAPGRVYTRMFETQPDLLAHIHLARDNDLLLVAPASANIIGKMAAGIADDLLSSLYVAFYRRVIIAPAMNTHMYEHPVVQENLERLCRRGVVVLEPEEGSLACGDQGRGRFPDPDTIFRFCLDTMNG